MKGSITFTIITGIMMLASVLVVHIMIDQVNNKPEEQPEIQPVQDDTTQWQGETAFQVSYGCGQVCADRPLRTPGGLGYVIATYCIGEYGDYELNTGHLLPDQYNELIQPMKDAVIGQARDQGVDLWWRGER